MSRVFLIVFSLIVGSAGATAEPFTSATFGANAQTMVKKPTQMNGPLVSLERSATQLKTYLWNVEYWESTMLWGQPEREICSNDSSTKLRLLLGAVESSSLQVRPALLSGQRQVAERELRQIDIALGAAERLYRESYECTQRVDAREYQVDREQSFPQSAQADTEKVNQAWY